MLKKFWRSLGSSEADNQSHKSTLNAANAPQLTESDYEFLFLQLLEGLAHGWQQPRIISFFEDIEDRISKQQWLDWLQGFGSRMLSAAAPDNNLASRMVQLGEMKCGEIGDLAYDVGMKILTRGQQPVFVDFNTEDLGSGDVDLFEFAGADFSADGTEVDEPVIYEFAGADAVDDTDYSSDDIVIDLAGNEAEMAGKEVKEVTLDEFFAILQQDPELARNISQEMGLDSPDPQAIIQALIAQAQSSEPNN